MYYRRIYRPKTRTRMADMVAQVMQAERLTVADLAAKANYSRQSIYGAFHEDKTGKKDFPYPMAFRLMDVMGYRIEMRVVRKDDDPT